MPDDVVVVLALSALLVCSQYASLHFSKCN